MARELTTAARAAKAIRVALTAQGLVVRVKSSNYSMGNSVDVSMTDQRPEVRKLVDAYCGKYCYGHFDGMTDCYEYSNKNPDLPQAKHVFVHNEMSDAMRDAIYQHLRERWGGGDELPPTYAEGRNLRFQHEYVDQFVSRLFADASGTFWKDRPLRAAPALAEVGQ